MSPCRRSQRMRKRKIRQGQVMGLTALARRSFVISLVSCSAPCAWRPRCGPAGGGGRSVPLALRVRGGGVRRAGARLPRTPDWRPLRACARRDLSDRPAGCGRPDFWCLRRRSRPCTNLATRHSPECRKFPLRFPALCRWRHYNSAAFPAAGWSRRSRIAANRSYCQRKE